jgi:rhamnose transport system ATP-binding protein
VPSNSTPLLRLNEIAKSFGAVRALRGVSFDLRPGEVHALLGENGAGKSTLIKVITGAHVPDDGTIELAGELVHPHRHWNPNEAHRRGVACIYQQPALFPDLSVAENIALRLEALHPFSKMKWRRHHERALHLLESIGADFDPRTEVRTLSMPAQQLVEIACAIGCEARAIIMDEPTSSLTRQEQERLFAIVRELRSRGTGIIYISHRLEEIFVLADRVTVLRDGNSIATLDAGTFDEAHLIELMVGREISHLYPPSEAPPGRTVLAAVALGCRANGVRGATFHLRAGEILGISGIVGAGRTELARILFGLDPADSGELRIDGKPVSIRSPRDAIRHGIACVPEDRRKHGVILEMAVSANVTLASHPQLFSNGWLLRSRETHLTQNFIQRLGIRTTGPLALAGTLSGGNQQKVSLARWLATKPKVLLLDEPTQGVDVGAKSEIHALIRSLAAEGLAVLMISSDLPEILGMSDRIAVMRHGTIAATFDGKCSAPQIMAAALGREAA